MQIRSEYKIDQADFTDWISFLSFDLMEETNLNVGALNLKSFISME